MLFWLLLASILFVKWFYVSYQKGGMRQVIKELFWCIILVMVGIWSVFSAIMPFHASSSYLFFCYWLVVPILIVSLYYYLFFQLTPVKAQEKIANSSWFNKTIRNNQHLAYAIIYLIPLFIAYVIGNMLAVMPAIPTYYLATQPTIKKVQYTSIKCINSSFRSLPTRTIFYYRNTSEGENVELTFPGNYCEKEPAIINTLRYSEVFIYGRAWFLGDISTSMHSVIDSQKNKVEFKFFDRR